MHVPGPLRRLERKARQVVRVLSDLGSGGHSSHRSIGQLAAYRKRAFWSVRRAAARLAGDRRETVVVGLLEHLGDIVAAEPIVALVRSRHPHARLLWAVHPRYRELVGAFPELDGTLIVRCLTEWFYLRRGGAFDRVYDLHLPGRSCSHCSLPDERRGADPVIDVDNYYAHGDLLACFCRVAGLPVLSEDPLLQIPATVLRRIDALALPESFVAIHGRSNQSSRDWDAAQWQRLVGWLDARGVSVVEVGTESVLKAPPPRGLCLCSKLSVLETAEVLRRAALFIGIDSGPAHLAHAVGTRGVVLLGHYRSFESYTPFAGSYGNGENADLLHAKGPVSTLPASTVRRAVAAALQLPHAGRSRAPAVTVVIAAYGHADLVLQSVRSVLRQSFTDREVVVVNDGSPDQTAEVLRPLAASGAIRYIEQPNRGQAAARNAGLRSARGRWVAFLDDDDTWPSDKLAWQIEAFERHPEAVLVYGEHAPIDGAPVDGGDAASPSGDVRAAFLRRNWIQSPGQTLIRTAALRAAGGFDQAIWGSDDWDLYIRLAALGPFVHEPRIALHWRRHAANASRHAARHAHNHFRVMRKHMGWNLPMMWQHLRLARAYFVPNLLACARESAASGSHPRALRALLLTLPFQPEFVTAPWFVAATARATWRGLRRALFRRPRL